MSVPNMITLVRIVLTPVFSFFYLHPVVFCAATNCRPLAFSRGRRGTAIAVDEALRGTSWEPSPTVFIVALCRGGVSPPIASFSCFAGRPEVAPYKLHRSSIVRTDVLGGPPLPY